MALRSGLIPVKFPYAVASLVLGWSLNAIRFRAVTIRNEAL